jgi:hypothetical protein
MKILSAVGLFSAFVYFVLPYLTPPANVPTYYNRVLLIGWALSIFLEYWWPAPLAFLRRTPRLFRLLFFVVLVMIMLADIRVAGFSSPYIWFDPLCLMSWGDIALSKGKVLNEEKGKAMQKER